MYQIPRRNKDRRRRLTGRFMRNNRGSIHILVALLTPVLMGLMGLVVDSVNHMRVHNQLQESVDGAALAVATQKSNVPKTSKRRLQTTAHAFVLGNFRGDQSLWDRNLSVKPIALTDTGVTVTATFKQKNFIMGFFNKPTTTLKAQASTMFNGPSSFRSRVALVLDNSDSMLEHGRLKGLQDATIAFAEYFKDKPRTEIGLVPFATYVNVGTHNADKNWIEVMKEGRHRFTREYCSMKKDVIDKTNCRMEEKVETTYPDRKLVDSERCVESDGVQKCTPVRVWDYGEPLTTVTEVEVCDEVFGEEYESCRTYNVSRDYEWDGCVNTRANGESELSYFKSAKFIGMTNTDCPHPITPPTNDFDTLKTAALGMVPDGETYIPQGIEWGRILLDPNVPMPYEQEHNTEKFMVIMSDGVNTRGAQHHPKDSGHVTWMYRADMPPETPTISAHDITGDTGTEMANAKMKERCDAAKAQGIRIFTIALGVDEGSESYDILKECASEDRWHFSFTDVSSLTPAFQEIAVKISKFSNRVRLTN